KVIFMRKLQAGGSEHSFGIHVAQMAGMPNPVVLRASEIMRHLEKDKALNVQKEKTKEMPKNNYKVSLFEEDAVVREAKELLDAMDIGAIPPVEALVKMNEIKQSLLYR